MDQELKKLIEKNIEVSKETQANVQYVKKVIIFQQILGIIKLLLIIIPIALGVLYLPSLIQDILEKYQGVF